VEKKDRADGRNADRPTQLLQGIEDAGPGTDFVLGQGGEHEVEQRCDHQPQSQAPQQQRAGQIPPGDLHLGAVQDDQDQDETRALQDRTQPKGPASEPGSQPGCPGERTDRSPERVRQGGEPGADGREPAAELQEQGEGKPDTE
jgi:hypothetical protein